MILEKETYEKFGYYPSDLTHGSEKYIVSACDDCGKIRIVKRHHYNHRCCSCAQKGKIISEETRAKISKAFKGKCTGNKNPFYGRHHTEESKQKISEKNKGKKGWNKGLLKENNEALQRISEAKKGAKNPMKRPEVRKKSSESHKGLPSGRKGKHHTQESKQKISSKKKEMYKDPEFAKRMHSAHAQKPTKPEKMWEEIAINHNSLPFKYTGNGEVAIGNKCPDFIHLTKKIVIEIFGYAYHSPLFTFRKTMYYHQTYKGTLNHYKKHGYKCIIFWDRDLLREDAEHFVLSTLKKERVL